MNHIPYDDPADYADPAPRTPAGCACFAPGEASGTCPGRENCPMACNEPEEPANEEADHGESL